MQTRHVEQPSTLDTDALWAEVEAVMGDYAAREEAARTYIDAMMAGAR